MFGKDVLGLRRRLPIPAGGILTWDSVNNEAIDARSRRVKPLILARRKRDPENFWVTAKYKPQGGEAVDLPPPWTLS